MKKRASYHTSLKELVFHELLPEKYLGKIPRTNLHRWRNDNCKRFIGSEINLIADKHTELIQTLNHYPKMFYAYGKLIKTLIDITQGVDNFNHVVRNQKAKVVQVISKVKDIVSIEKAVKVFNISKSTFHTWVTDVKLSCDKSFFKMCNRVYPNQIMPHEINNIKNALLNPRNRHWSMMSVYWDGVRKGLITVSENTFFKVNKLLGIRGNQTTIKKKKRHKQGVRAKAPNEIWHADITTLKALNGKRYYIYLVVDNFSRQILSYSIQEKVSGLITKQTIEEAYAKAFQINQELNVKLIVDGGPENHNFHVNDFIKRSEINIKKLTALKDLNYSNSMVERINRTLKYRYIFPKEPRDLKHLQRIVHYFIKDYNIRKPHSKLNGLTPDEAYRGIKPPTKQKIDLIKQAKQDRLIYSKQNRCKMCH